MAAGIDPARQPIPVAPAAHYHMGGIATDAHGRSSLPGLWVVGECAVHRPAWRQPPGLQFPAGRPGVRRPRRRTTCRASWRRRDARRSARAGAFRLPAPPHVLRGAMSRDVALERNEDGLRERWT